MSSTALIYTKVDAIKNKALILRLRTHDNPASGLTTEQLKDSTHIIGRNMSMCDTIGIPNKDTLILKLQSMPSSTCLDEPNSSARTTSGEPNSSARIDSTQFGRVALGGRTSSDEPQYFIREEQSIGDRVEALKSEFFNWRLDYSLNRSSNFSSEGDSERGFASILTRNSHPIFPTIYSSDRVMSSEEVKNIDMANLLDSAVRTRNPVDNWYSPVKVDCTSVEEPYSNTVQDELTVLYSLLSRECTLESYLGDLVEDDVVDKEMLDNKTLRVKLGEALKKRYGILASLQEKVIAPLLTRFGSRHQQGCVFPIGIFYDYLLKIKYAKKCMMHGSTYGNSNIFTGAEKALHESFRAEVRESAMAFAVDASDEYESGWDEYEDDMLLKGFMVPPSGLTHAQKYNLYEYRESLLDELHMQLRAVREEITSVLPVKK